MFITFSIEMLLMAAAYVHL